MASANHLDDLLNTTYDNSTYQSIATQSEIATATTLTSVTVATTGAPGMIGIALPGVSYKIVAINDANNTITLEPLANGVPDAGTQTDFVLGLGPNGILISPNNEATVAGQYASNNSSIADAVLSILSPTPITTGVNETFTKTGSTTATTPPQPPPTGSLTAKDTTTNAAVTVAPTAYTGPVVGVQDQFIDITVDNLNITATGPNYFLHSGSGNDALTVSSGINVLDGGTGSNFLTGGTGTDTFFVDSRGATTDLWSTLKNFHTGDTATLFGISQMGFALNWSDNGGAVGNTGLTLHATVAGKPTTSMTLVGFSQADMTNGRLTIAFGTDAASGSPFMTVHGN